MAYTNTTGSLGLKLIETFTEDEAWGNITNANLDDIDDNLLYRANLANGVESDRQTVASDLNTASGSVDTHNNTLDDYEGRIEDIEAIGEYECDFASLIATIDDLDAEKVTIQSTLDSMGLGGTGYTGTYIFIGGDRAYYTFEFIDGLLTDYTTFSPFVAYKMDSLTSNVVVDDSGNSNDGTAVGVTYGADYGIVDGGYDFDGNDDYITVPSFTPTDSLLTMGVWIKPTSITSERFIYIYRISNSSFFAIQITSDNKIQLAYRNTGVTIYRELFDTTTTIPDGEYHHIVVTVDGSVYSLYIDGIYQANIDTEYTIVSSAPSYVHTISNTSSYSFHGRMDEFVLYHTVLSSNEIAKLYELGEPYV